MLNLCGRATVESYWLRTIAENTQKCKPKKLQETNEIFEYVHAVNKIADTTDGIVRISIDTKTGVKVGPFSRGGYSRLKTKVWDHDYTPETILKPFGISLPALNENHIYFTESNVTADFMVDALEYLWPSLKKRFDPHTIVINADNGPENSSRRSQLMKSLIEFSHAHEVNISLAYYPPYHSKYNPIERVWGVLEKHWQGELLDSVEKVIGLARTMTYNKKKPFVKYVKEIYEKGVSLSKTAHEQLEAMMERVPKIEKWSNILFRIPNLFCLYLGTKTTWYLQSHLTCDKLYQSCIGSFSIRPFGAFPEDEPILFYAESVEPLRVLYHRWRV